MRRKSNASESNPQWVHFIIFLLALLSFSGVYKFVSTWHNPHSINVPNTGTLPTLERENVEESNGCCKGVEHLELWGDVVIQGKDFKVNSSQECCMACKDMCNKDGPCLCDTWVFCGNKNKCGDKFGECWLKKQEDTLAPDRQIGDVSMWTSGLVVGEGGGIIGLVTEYGTLHIKLFTSCSPRSVFYMLETLSLRLCAGCYIFRAESRGRYWDSQGNHVKDSSFGPPYALIQGTLESPGLEFHNISNEFHSSIKRGSVAWVGSGHEFFISLANHNEWKGRYTVFGTVLPEDMVIADKIAELPTKPDVWNGINVSVLENPVPLKLTKN